jgi:uncharacterized protein YyaL (SSP411 family)
MSSNSFSNHLVGETSPYLLQHARNPVDWYPWGEDALALARRADKPILLSIGYSACHWCHVMERESFEDTDTARFMNEHFVCVKVDREERPDLDKIYQTAHQLLTQRPGGWPLNVVITPSDQVPFFAGTYFPPQPRHGMPAFTDVLRRIVEFYAEKRESLVHNAATVKDAFLQLEAQSAGDGTLSDELLDQAVATLRQQFDEHHGGFGSAPKFPYPTSLETCLRGWARRRDSGQADPRLLHMAAHTLSAMADGGIYDQLAGGFYRYSVDQKWSIPHFEKMLYDNAQLLSLYVDGWLATGMEGFRDVAVETAQWVIRDMQDPDGGFYSTLDADSEGREGEFYVWTVSELRSLLSEEEYAVTEARYGLTGAPNFEGRWHLNVARDMAGAAEVCGIDEPLAAQRLLTARRKLLERRAQRVWPARDEKILTSWNALMIQGMARAGRLLGRPELIDSAQRALDFVREVLFSNGRLYATTKGGSTRLNAYLDDHAFLIAAALESLQARWRPADLDFARALAGLLLRYFQDEEDGGFYFTADDHEQLLYRQKPAGDDATPSGNGVAALALLRLGHLLGDAELLAAAERVLRGLAGAMASYPAAHGALLGALEEYLNPTEAIVIRGDEAAAAPWLDACRQDYAPRRMVYWIPETGAPLPGILGERKNLDTVTAYVCSGHACLAPVTELAEFRRQVAVKS